MTALYSGILSPVCEVVIGVGHVDQTLDEVGTLYEAEEHLQTNTQISGQLNPRVLKVNRCCFNNQLLVFSLWKMYLSQTRDVQALPVLYRGLAGFARPRPFALAVSEAGPGEDVVVGQVQVCGVHRELADQLQQAGQAVQQPLQRRQMENKVKTTHKDSNYSFHFLDYGN